MFLSWKQERVPLKLQKLLVIFNRSSRLCSLCLVIDVSCKFCLLCWKLSSEHRGYSFPRVLYIFFSYCACSYARIISVQNPNPLSDCGQVSLVVTITVLQLKICLNNFSYETIWIMCNSASDPPPGTDILKLFPSPAWQWPVIYRLVFISQPPPSSVLGDSWTSLQWSKAGASHAHPSLKRRVAKFLLSGKELLHTNMEKWQINSQTSPKTEHSSDGWQRNSSSLTASKITDLNNHHT